jgi:hypothetical protein
MSLVRRQTPFEHVSGTKHMMYLRGDELVTKSRTCGQPLASFVRPTSAAETLLSPLRIATKANPRMITNPAMTPMLFMTPDGCELSRTNRRLEIGAALTKEPGRRWLQAFCSIDLNALQYLDRISASLATAFA